MANQNLATKPSLNKVSDYYQLKSNKTLTFADLFAGIGGFHLALSQLNAHCVFASEINSQARQTYYDNFKNDSPYIFQAGILGQSDRFNQDINDLDIKMMPYFDILCAGFPCQAFSISGKRLGLKDARGTLFFKIAQIIKHKQPRVIFLENVKNMLSHNQGQTFELFLKILNDLNYDVHYKILRSSDFGIPQARERIYIVGFLKSLKILDFKFPQTETKTVVVKDILEDNPDQAKIINRDDIVIHTHIDTSKDRRSPLQVGYFGKNRIGERIYSINHAGVTLMAFGGGMASKTGAYLVGDKIRKLSPRECARMHGFPDSFRINPSINQALQQFGNTISIPVIRAIYKQIEQCLNS